MYGQKRRVAICELPRIFWERWENVGIFKEKCVFSPPLRPTHPIFSHTLRTAAPHLPCEDDVIRATSHRATFVFPPFFSAASSSLPPRPFLPFSTPSDSRPRPPQMSPIVRTPIPCETSPKNAPQLGGVLRFRRRSHIACRVPFRAALQSPTPVRARAPKLAAFYKMKRSIASCHLTTFPPAPLAALRMPPSLCSLTSPSRAEQKSHRAHHAIPMAAAEKNAKYTKSGACQWPCSAACCSFSMGPALLRAGPCGLHCVLLVFPAQTAVQGWLCCYQVSVCAMCAMFDVRVFLHQKRLMSSDFFD